MSNKSGLDLFGRKRMKLEEKAIEKIKAAMQKNWINLRDKILKTRQDLK